MQAHKMSSPQNVWEKMKNNAYHNSRCFTALFYGSLLLTTIGFLAYFYNGSNQYVTSPDAAIVEEKSGKCEFNYKLGERECWPLCDDANMFSVPGTSECLWWLECKDIKSQLEFLETIGKHKLFTEALGTWKGHRVTIMRRINEKRRTTKRFRRIINVLQFLSPSPYIQQYIGHCGDILIVEHHSFGYLDETDTILSKLKSMNTIPTRFSIFLSYLEVLDYLHSHKPGPLVLCGRIKLKNYLRRFRITYNLKVILADVDKLSVLKPGRPACPVKTHNKNQAPEEYPNENSTITEKREIWRIPQILKFIVGDDGIATFNSEVNDINAKCRAENPSARPTAKEVLQTYIKIGRNLGYKRINR